MATFPSRRPPVARAPVGNVSTERDSHFSWVMPNSIAQTSRGRYGGSLESLSESAETNQSSSVTSLENNSPNVSRLPPNKFTLPNVKLVMPVPEPAIVEADPNPPLQGKKVKKKASASKASKEKVATPATPASKSSTKEKEKPASPSTGKSSSKSIVPSAFRFGTRSKTLPPPAPETEAPKISRVPSLRSSLPIAARFAKANRQSWIQKYGSADAVKGPTVPSSKPTLSFINELPGMSSMPVPPVPPIPAFARSSEDGPARRTPSPVADVLSPKSSSLDLPSARRVMSPTLRIKSPEPTEDIPLPPATPAAIRIMYPKRKPAPAAPMPAPTGPLPEPPVARSDAGTSSSEQDRLLSKSQSERAIPRRGEALPSRSASAGTATRAMGLPKLPGSNTPTVIQVSRTSPSPPPVRSAPSPPPTQREPSPTMRSVAPLRPIRTSPSLQAQQAQRPGLPTSPLPSGRTTPLPATGRTTPTLQPSRSMTSPPSGRMTPVLSAGRATPPLPMRGRTMPVPASGRSTPVESPKISSRPSLDRLVVPVMMASKYTVTASAPTSPMQSQGEDYGRTRAFIPAPPASSGLRRTPSLPPARRDEVPSTPLALTSAKRGREHPFPLRPVAPRARPAPSAYSGSVTDEEDDRLARVGFYLPAASVSATDLSSSSLRPPPFNSNPRISEARSSMYSQLSADDSLYNIMNEAQHDERREKLIDNVERIIRKDARVMI